MQKQHSRFLKYLFLIMGIALLGLILFSLQWQTTKTSSFLFTYNGFKFQADNYGYKLQLYVNQQPLPASVHLREDPRTLENISVEGDIQILRQKKQIYVTLDPYTNLTGKTTIGALEIDSIIDNPYLFNIPVSSSFTKPYLNNTLRTCDDVNATEGVILLQLAEKTSVREDKGCIYVEGITEDDLIRASDRLVYTLLKVMKP